MTLSGITRANQRHPKILRLGHGFEQYIDTDTAEGYEYFAEAVVQDYEAADELIDLLNRTGEAEANADGNPRYYESYRVVTDDEWSTHADATARNVVQ